VFSNVEGFLSPKGDLIALRDPETGRVWFVTEATPVQAEIVTTGLDAWTALDVASSRPPGRRLKRAQGLRLLPSLAAMALL
jgi:hypothetical protein